MDWEGCSQAHGTWVEIRHIIIYKEIRQPPRDSSYMRKKQTDFNLFPLFFGICLFRKWFVWGGAGVGWGFNTPSQKEFLRCGSKNKLEITPIGWPLTFKLLSKSPVRQAWTVEKHTNGWGAGGPDP